MIHHHFQVVHSKNFNVTQDGILGADFLRKCKASIDFKDNTIRILSNAVNTIKISDKTKSNKKTKHTNKVVKIPNFGIYNPSRLCFANSLYQAIVFSHFSTERALGASMLKINKCPCISNIMLQTANTLVKSIGPVQADSFHESVKTLFNNLDNQEDALELLSQLIISIIDDLHCCPANQIGIDWIQKITGNFEKEINCTKCTHITKQTENFHTLQIYPRKNMQDSLENYFIQEELESRTCSQCTASYTSVLSTKVVNLPEILAIHFVPSPK